MTQVKPEKSENQPHLHHFVHALEAKALKKRPLTLKFADEMTQFFGSFQFLILNITAFAGWILINTGLLPVLPVFDPYPFVMLTTIVSLEAIFLTTIVLMSQNRQSLISSLREEVDVQVNLISEREITKVLRLLKLLLDKEGIKVTDKELEDMLDEIDASYIEKRLEQQLSEK
jgi:uncharacterized membrane protein